MKYLLLSFFIILLSACSSEKDIKNCKKAFILDALAILTQETIAQEQKEDVLFTMCMSAKTYKENNDIISAVYDSFEGNQYVYKSYLTAQLDLCITEHTVQNLDLEKTLDIALEANEFRKQHMNAHCSKLLDLDHVLKPH